MSKCIAIVLIGVTIGTPIFRTANAMENKLESINEQVVDTIE